MGRQKKTDEIASVYLMVRIGKNRKQKFMTAILKESVSQGRKLSIADIISPIIDSLISKHESSR
jgi:hypothetical protein